MSAMTGNKLRTKAQKRRRRQQKQPALPLEKHIQRSRWMRTASAGVVLMGLLILLAADRAGYFGQSGGDFHQFSGRTFVCVGLSDSAILQVDTPHGDVAVRLWGVLAAKSEASAWDELQSRVVGQPVQLHIEPHRQRDRAGRLLAYVQLPDRTILNEWLLAEGMAQHDPTTDHRQFDRYILIEKQAKRDQRGLWAAGKSAASADATEHTEAEPDELDDAWPPQD